MSKRKAFHDPNTCGCCQGIAKITPLETANRPGLPMLSYRVGTHATFLETMKAGLSNACLNCDEADETTFLTYLGEVLTTRSSDDPAIALLDAWATVGDVLTFYQERIANEGYLRTATERFSILELARLVGYKLQPGVASSVYLAFTLEDKYEVEIPEGTRAQSVPNPGETMESFETAESLFAKFEWNAIQPRLHRPTYITSENASSFSVFYVNGISNNLGPNDMLLFNFGSQQTPRLIQSVDVQAIESRTKIELQPQVIAAAQAIEKIRKIVASYLAEETATEMAARVKTNLTGLQKELAPQMTADHFNKALDNALLKLKAEHRVAVQSNFSRLSPWIGNIIADFESVQVDYPGGLVEIPDTSESSKATETTETTEASETSGTTATTNHDDGYEPKASAFDKLVTGLLKPLTEQPRTAKRLERKEEVVYGSGADIAPHLLTRFNPRLQGTLYPAWSNTVIVEPRIKDLQNVAVFRTKAAPFGHNAPLKPVYDSEGRVIGSREWDIQTFSLELIPEETYENESSYLTAMQASLTLAHYDTYNVNVLLQAEAEMVEVEFLDTTIPFTITSSDPGSSGVPQITSLVFQLFDEEIEIKFEPYYWTVTISGQIFNFYSSSSRRVLIDGSEYILTLSSYRDHFQLILVPPPPTLLAKTILPLDREIKEILPGSWVVIERPALSDPTQKERRVRKVTAVDTVSHAGYGLTGKTTTLTLDGNWLDDNDKYFAVIRHTTVYAQSEPLTLVDEPIEAALCDIQIYEEAEIAGASELELDGLYEGLEAGRWIIVKGERTDIEGVDGVIGTERVMIAGVKHGPHQFTKEDNKVIDLPGDTAHTILQLANNLAYCYKRNTVTIYGNVVKATHGETREETLGSGDGSQILQAFKLKHHPLTFTSAATAVGVESSLTVRVNEVAWEEADNLFSLSPQDRQFITERDNEEKTTITFGDGVHGARLPTGPDNVTAVYRSGIGKPGNVQAEQISLLASKPLGVKEVINPLAASGGADAESRDQARRNAPLAVMALDRLVSERDYADFARTFAGVGKASAARLSDGMREVLHVTIAGADDIPIETDSDLYHNLRQALYQFGDPRLPIQLAIRELSILFIKARVKIQEAYHWESVETDIRAALLAAFSFENRELGQDAALSAVLSIIQAVPGVAFVDVDILDTVAETASLDSLTELAETLTLKNRIAAHTDRLDTSVSPPQLRQSKLVYLRPDVPDTLLLELIS